MKRLITLIFIFANITAFGQSVTRQLTFNSKISEGNNPDSLGFTGPGLQPGYFYKAAYIRTHFGGTDSLYFNTTIGGLGTFLSPLGVVMDTIGYLKADWYIRNNAHIFKADSMQVLNAPVNQHGVLRLADTATLIVPRQPNGDVYINGRLYPIMGFISDSASYINSNGGTTLTITQTDGGSFGLRVNGQSYFNGYTQYTSGAQYGALTGYSDNIEFGSAVSDNHGIQWNIGNTSTNFYHLKFSTTDSLLHYYHTYTGAFPTHGNALVTFDDLSGTGNPDSLANHPASYYLDRSNHTGTQAQSTIVNLVTDLAGKQSSLGFTPENVANKATGFGTLNNTLYPTTQAVATYVASQIPTTPSLQSVATVGNSYTGQIQAQSLAATGTAGAGYDDLISQSASPTSTTGHIKIYSDSLNRLSWKNSTYRRTIQVPYPSDYTIRMPYLVTGTTLEDSTHAAATYGTITNLALKANIANPTFTGTVTIPTPFTLGATSVTSTGTQLNYLNAATGTTGTTSTNLVYSTSPTLVTPVLGVATATSLNGNTFTTGTYTLTGAAGKTLTFNNSLTFSGTDGGVITIPSGTVTLVTMGGANNFSNANSFNRNAIAAATTQALVAGNSTAATVGTVSQWSPYMGYTGAGWNTTSAASNTVNFNTELRPVSAAAVTGDLVTKSQVNAGGFTDIFTLNSSGAATHTGTIVATANSQVALGLKGTYTFTDGAFTGVIHDAYQLNFGASLTSYFHITDATGTGETDLHFGGSTPTSSNWAFRGNTASTYLNAPTTSLFMRVANTTIGTWGGTGLTMSLATRFFVTEGTNGSVGQTALVAGTKAITITGITTSSRAFVQMVTPGSTTLTTTYQAVCTANTLTLQANVAAGTINTADTSTLNYWIIN